VGIQENDLAEYKCEACNSVRINDSTAWVVWDAGKERPKDPFGKRSENSNKRLTCESCKTKMTSGPEFNPSKGASGPASQAEKLEGNWKFEPLRWHYGNSKWYKEGRRGTGDDG